MTSTSTSSSKHQLPGWKDALRECLELRSQGGLSAYRRITLLVKVFDDQEFCDEVPFKAARAEKLDLYVDDLALRFLDLAAMLRYFPEESAWAAGRLRSMFAEMQARERVKVLASPPPETRTHANRLPRHQQPMAREAEPGPFKQCDPPREEAELDPERLGAIYRKAMQFYRSVEHEFGDTNEGRMALQCLRPPIKRIEQAASREPVAV